MTDQKSCTCEPPVAGCPDYGQSWTFKRDFTGPMVCGRCGGAMRPDQDQQLAAEWMRSMALPSPEPFTSDY